MGKQEKIGMRKYLYPCLGVCLLVSGCMSSQKNNLTAYEQYTNSSGERLFKYVAMSTVFYPTNSPDAEQTRLNVLQEWITENNYCSNGYKIMSRSMVSRGAGPDAMNITYTGQCK